MACPLAAVGAKFISDPWQAQLHAGKCSCFLQSFREFPSPAFSAKQITHWYTINSYHLNNLYLLNTRDVTVQYKNKNVTVKQNNRLQYIFTITGLQLCYQFTEVLLHQPTSIFLIVKFVILISLERLFSNPFCFVLTFFSNLLSFACCQDLH